MSADELFSTNSYDDPDPDGTDVYGMIPLLAELEGPDEDDEDEDEDEDERGDNHSRFDNSGDDEGDQELPPAIEASSINIEVPEGTTFEDDDDAFDTLTASGVTDLFPGEARALIEYMRPLTPEEQDLAEDPYLNDLRWTDDPAHVDDVLKAGKGDRGLDNFLDDATYGDIHMKSPEEIAERRYGNDKPIRFPARAPSVVNPLARRRFVAKATNTAVVVGLARKLKVEHANWLAEQDKTAGLAVRPRSYYENVAKLWTGKQLKDARIPTTASGNWGASPKKFVRAAQGVLAKTTTVRSRFSPVLGDQVDMGWWNPVSAAKSAIKTAVKYTVSKPLQYGYKYGKMAVTKPFVYTYKGVKYVGNKAKQLALAPLRAIIRRYGSTIANRRASALAKQRGLKAPTSVEKVEASSWAKSFVRSKGGKYGGAIASLMGSGTEYGARDVDISFGAGGDVMGLSKAGTAGLIVLGPIGLVALLTGLVKMSSGSGAPQPDPGTPEADAEAAAAADDGSADPGAGDPGAGDPGAGDPGAGSADPGAADDGSADSSGYADNLGLHGRARDKPKPRSRKSYKTDWSKNVILQKFPSGKISVEQMNKLSKEYKFYANNLIKMGRLRLA